MSQDRRRIFPAVVLACLAVLLIAVPAFSQAASGVRTLPNTQILGAEDQSKQIAVTFWLNQHDKAGFDDLVRQMYDRNSPNYHHWLTMNEYKARFAPNAGDMAVVRQHLAAHNLHVVASDKLNRYVTARGSVADVQRATGVQLNRVSINGEVHRAPSGQVVISGAAGRLVSAVQGLSDLKYKNYAKRATDPDTGKPVMVPLSKVNPESKVGPAVQFFNANCLHGTQSRDFKTGGGGPYALYSGARYGGNINLGPPSLPPCGYDAVQVDTAYGLTALYKDKLDGTGQTVVIVDAYGSDTITSDANVFAEINGLPALTASNFAIYYPTGPTNCGGNTCGWDVETSLDVEWSHSVAPGANIALLLALDNSFTSLDLSVLYAIDNELGPVISNSYGLEEYILETEDPSELTVQNTLTELAASLGMSANFSSGDDGDFALDDGVDYGYHAGRFSLCYRRRRHQLVSQSRPLYEVADRLGQQPDPHRLSNSQSANRPAALDRLLCWSRRRHQRRLVASRRSKRACPVDGGSSRTSRSWPIPIPASSSSIPKAERRSSRVVGGTSLACPMFSGMWAISTQAAGAWLGQAAPLLYSLPADAITDVVATTGPDNVTGTIHQPPQPPIVETADELAAPLENTTDYVSALYNGTSTRWYVITFGTDTSLTTGPGWDNVTGLGTPNGASFVTAVTPQQ